MRYYNGSSRRGNKALSFFSVTKRRADFPTRNFLSCQNVYMQNLSCTRSYASRKAGEGRVVGNGEGWKGEGGGAWGGRGRGEEGGAWGGRGIGWEGARGGQGEGV